MRLKYIVAIGLTWIIAGACAKKDLDKTGLKPRIVVLTDIAPNDIEPDDMESMIRLLVHADLFEVEALVASTGWSNTGGLERIDLIHGALNAYEKDLPNLKKRSGQEKFDEDDSKQKIGYWPSTDYFRSRTVMGSTKMGMKHIGEGNDSEGSKRIISLADEKDQRPIWIAVWGGGNTFAQAIWRVQQERTAEELASFLQKFRIYTITDQDRPWSSGDTISYAFSSHQWMRQFDKDLIFFWDECGWKHQNAIGKQNWDQYARHIQNHGNLGALYPKYKWGVEGDTPSFLHLIPNGLSNPDMPNQVSWSGYFERSLGRDSVTYSYTNYAGKPYEICTEYFAYFYPAMFNNFAARMDWAKDGKGNRNPVVAINKDNSLGIMEIVCNTGEEITLNASKSFDPDGDELQFKWWIIPEAGTFSQEVEILNKDPYTAKVLVPESSAGKRFHLICEVSDDGNPNLSSYRRIIFNVK